MGEQVGVDIRTGMSGFGVLVETGCRYLRELHFGGTPVLGLRLDRISHSSVVYEVGLFVNDPAAGRHGDASPVAVGRFVHVYVDHDSRRPVAVPALVRAALERLRPGQHNDRGALARASSLAARKATDAPLIAARKRADRPRWQTRCRAAASRRRST